MVERVSDPAKALAGFEQGFEKGRGFPVQEGRRLGFAAVVFEVLVEFLFEEDVVDYFEEDFVGKGEEVCHWGHCLCIDG